MGFTTRNTTRNKLHNEPDPRAHTGTTSSRDIGPIIPNRGQICSDFRQVAENRNKSLEEYAYQGCYAAVLLETSALIRRP